MSDTVILQGGSAYGHLFENPAAKVERWVYWAVSLELSDELSMSIEWLRFDPAMLPLGEAVQCSNETKPEAEASVYVFSHEWVDRWSLEMTPLPDGRFRVAIDARVPVEDDDGEVQDVTVQGETEIGFDGILLVKSSLAEKPDSEAAALNALAPFAEDQAFAVADEDFRFVLTPVSAA